MQGAHLLCLHGNLNDTVYKWVPINAVILINIDQLRGVPIKSANLKVSPEKCITIIMIKYIIFCLNFFILAPNSCKNVQITRKTEISTGICLPSTRTLVKIFNTYFLIKFVWWKVKTCVYCQLPLKNFLSIFPSKKRKHLNTMVKNSFVQNKNFHRLVVSLKTRPFYTKQKSFLRWWAQTFLLVSYWLLKK